MLSTASAGMARRFIVVLDMCMAVFRNVNSTDIEGVVAEGPSTYSNGLLNSAKNSVSGLVENFNPHNVTAL